MTSKKTGLAGFNAVVAVVIGLGISLVLVTFCVIIPGIHNKQRRNDVTMVQSALREYMSVHKNKAPGDSGSKVTEAELKSGEEIVANFQVTNTSASHSLDELGKTSFLRSGMTDKYFVTNAGLSSDVSTVAWTMADSQKPKDLIGDVFIYVGGRCTDENQHHHAFFLLNNTGLRTDVATFRLLGGSWYCLNL